MSTATATKPSALDLIRAKAKSAPSSKKSDTPIIERPDLADLLREWQQAKADFNAAESRVKVAADQVAAVGRDERIKASRRLGKVVSTVKLVGHGASCDVTTTSRYCAIAQESEAQQARLAELQAAFGDDAPLYFRERLEVTPTEEALGDEDFLAGFVGLLMEHYGEKFDALFKTKQSFTPTKAFHEAYTLRGDVQAKAQPFVDDQTIKGYAPSVKQ